ncbi:hypothetical protein P152DRAFT_471727 [Eremomyces bilateralis CBS 781.70]|uniref:DUF676 domain-containing protein n=1 Tax=Eremomyces bilateralis CBS 781.70 TaxID=1392243 RepID=A0A6G1GAR2_9PEZI|nr:uncharacterized protein P152DRAFT_471727 [Eremomyces bilateralis CBS 781.70]KAF1815092.1 hypothetical protein P152DRAFT_471727 [Eremomyces bilateralis CBS 781.70]
MDQEQMLSLRAVTNPLHPSVEIIAIASPSDHADQPNKAWKSWTAPNGRNWLRDYLPSERPNARVLFFSSTVRGHDLEHSESIIDTIAKRLLSRVIRAREKDGVPEDVPIIFIAHSLGAFVLKAALLFASQARHQGFQTIYNQTSRIVFLAAPHVWRHAEQNLGKLASAIAKVSSVPSSDAFLDALEDSGEVLQDINEDFIEMNKDAPLEIINFAETLPTPNWGYGRGVILGLPSSSLPVDFEDEEDELFEDATPLKKSHLSICTFSSRSDEDYGKVFATMKKRQHRRRHRNHPYPQRRPTNLSESAPDLHTPPSSSRPPRHGKEGHEPDPDPPSLKDRVKDTARGLADILEPLSVIAPIVIGGGRKMYKWNRARSASKVSTTSTSSRPQPMIFTTARLPEGGLEIIPLATFVHRGAPRSGPIVGMKQEAMLHILRMPYRRLEDIRRRIAVQAMLMAKLTTLQVHIEQRLDIVPLCRVWCYGLAIFI